MYRKIILTCAAVVAAIGLAFATVPASAKSHRQRLASQQP